MNIGEVASIVGDTPFMTVSQATRITSLIKKHHLARILELGFAHGVSTCYLAAAVDGLEQGAVTSIDLIESENREPRAEELLERCGLSDRVELLREPQSFTWRIMYWLEEGRRECFDLVYLDGGHSWNVTGFAFFLVDRLLAPGGWLIFDDIDWTFAASPWFQGERGANLPEDYRNTPQVRKVFELLVEPHPAYENCAIEGSWGLARKRRMPPERSRWLGLAQHRGR